MQQEKDTLNNLELAGSSETGTLIFAIVFFIITGGFWLWVCFMDGAKKWSESLIRTKSNIYGINYKQGSPLIKPVVLKTVMTLILICAAGLLIGAVT